MELVSCVVKHPKQMGRDNRCCRGYDKDGMMNVHACFDRDFCVLIHPVFFLGIVTVILFGYLLKSREKVSG